MFSGNYTESKIPMAHTHTHRKGTVQGPLQVSGAVPQSQLSARLHSVPEQEKPALHSVPEQEKPAQREGFPPTCSDRAPTLFRP
jgi:hypothetical protein